MVFTNIVWQGVSLQILQSRLDTFKAVEIQMKSWRFLANIEYAVLLLILDPLLPNIEYLIGIMYFIKRNIWILLEESPSSC